MHLMLQKGNPTPGRPPAFDEADVVTNAVAAFWSHGYSGTTIGELERATGVDRSTIYNSFGGKRGLYAKAAAEYVRRGENELLSPLAKGSNGLADIVEFLDLLQAAQRDESVPAGCLIMNDLTTPADDEMTDRYLTALRQGLEAAVQRSNRTDETNPAHNATRVETLLAAIIGINVTHRRDQASAGPSQMVDGLRQLVRDWAGT